MNDSRELQVESICSGKLSHVSSQPAIAPSPCVESRAATKAFDPDTWNLLGTSGNVFDSPLAPNRFVIDTLSEACFTLGIKVSQAKTQCEIVQGNLPPEVKNEIERDYSNAEICKETVNQEFFLSIRRSISTVLHG